MSRGKRIENVNAKTFPRQRNRAKHSVLIDWNEGVKNFWGLITFSCLVNFVPDFNFVKDGEDDFFWSKSLFLQLKNDFTMNSEYL